MSEIENKNRKTIEIAESSFDPSQTINHTLSIRFIPNGFSLVVFNRTDNKILYFLEITETNKEAVLLFKENVTALSILQNNFKEVLCIWDTVLYTLLPSFIFNEENIVQFWELNFDKDETANLSFLWDKLKWQDMVNIYTVPAEVYSFLVGIYPSIQFVHQQSVHIVSSLFENKRENNSQVYLQVHSGFLDALVLQQGKLILANSYRFQDTDEFLYFSINLFEQFHLNQYSTSIILSGEINEEDEKTAGLRRYIRTVGFKKLSSDISGIDLKKTANPNLYVNLFNLPLCVL